MRRVQVHGPDDVRLDEVAEPAPGPGDVVVRVSACGICGTDLRYVRLGGLAGPTREPMPLGHELAGVVESAGADVAGLAPGARVVLNPTAGGNMIGNGGGEGGFAPRLLVRDATAGALLFSIPSGMDADVAALSTVRVMGPCIAMGAAAAHALDLAGSGSVHQIDIAALQVRLSDNLERQRPIPD